MHEPLWELVTVLRTDEAQATMSDVADLLK